MTDCPARILVVDDDAFSRILLQTSLSEEGYEVSVAENGKQALQVLEQEPFQLVITDLFMEEMDGFELLQWIKNNEKFQHIPVIVITGEDEMENTIRSIEMGAIDYLSKPFDPVLLHTRIRNTLRAVNGAGYREPETSGRILLVDDDILTQKIISINMEEQGYKMEAVDNGRTALELLHNETFDLVLLDLNMPGMSGFEVLSVIKKDSRLSILPVIVISGDEEMDSVIRSIEMGAEDFLQKPIDPVLLKARISACIEKKKLRDNEQLQQQKLTELNRTLEIKNRFIRQTFNLYMSNEVVDTILKSPEGLALGGEKRTITIMMTDLRGFTAISEDLPPENIVEMLNTYFNVMTNIIFEFQGTIDALIGDAILAIFGAPISRENDAERAVACAVKMQLAIEEVNRRNKIKGYPELAMGIGINTGETVVGNIGSSKRMKYSIIGRHVNLAARIESYTVGGQIYVSESTLNACNGLLRIDGQRQVAPKGIRGTIGIYDIGGIDDPYNLYLPDKASMKLQDIDPPLRITLAIIEGKHGGEICHEAEIVKYYKKYAEIRSSRICRELTDLKITLYDTDNKAVSSEIYAKVTEIINENPPVLRINFTSLPPDAERFFFKPDS